MHVSRDSGLSILLRALGIAMEGSENELKACRLEPFI